MKADVTIDLKEEGLRHAPGKVDGCGGKHLVEIDLDAEDLHDNDDCWQPPAVEEWKPELQKLHEAAHPDGVVFVENCREVTCEQLMAVFSP